ncbi:hypothetical protein EON65_41025 [archaeon]|nr:MAG: hypothetical protein EON65_41025 [archaeon]
MKSDISVSSDSTLSSNTDDDAPPAKSASVLRSTDLVPYQERTLISNTSSRLRSVPSALRGTANALRLVDAPLMTFPVLTGAALSM